MHRSKMNQSAPAAVPLPRPAVIPTERRSATRFFVIVGMLGALVIFSAVAVWRHDPAPLFWTTAGYFSYELGLNVLLVAAAFLGLRARRRTKAVDRTVEAGRAALSVLIAAHNERGCIFDTLESVFAQEGVDLQVIVASDGSTDGMNEALAARYGLKKTPGKEWEWLGEPSLPLVVLTLPKLGKGGALNAALAEARAPVCATLDADTRLAPGALAALAGAFRDEQVAAAGGFVYVRNAAGGPWIVRYQYWEYVKNFMWRIGLAHLGVCLQVSGAFGAFRTGTLRGLGGFSGASLVEDYEIIYRLHERLRLDGREYRVEVVPDAVAFTDSPDTVPSFLHQRTRWFTGFLQTLWEYRRMVGDRRMGAVGVMMLPIKCVDAILPLWGSLSLAILLAATVGGNAHWQRAGLELFLLRWGVDLFLSLVMWHWHRRLFPDRRHALAGGTLGFHMASEGLVFNWFRQIAVLNAYSWFVRRVQKWHQPRWGNAEVRMQNAKVRTE